METIKAFYFANKNRKLRYNDNRSIVVGETHTVSGKIELCENGLHASKRLIDALLYAPGSILYLVELSGKFDENIDKLCASKRKYLAEFDATEVLKEFARKQAMLNIKLIKPYCKDGDYEVIINFLKTGKDGSAASSAAYGAARSANDAKAATYAADAAYIAARYANAHEVYAAAITARYVADAYTIPKSEANTMLTEMIKEATGWDI